jgi:hypothetical protein
MRWRRGLAALIWGAVVMIAIQLVPTTVRAHAGHTHVAHVLDTRSAATVPVHHARDHTAKPTPGLAHVPAEFASTSPGDEPGTTHTCMGGCCASGCPCCVPMTLAESEPSWPPLSNALDINVPAPPTRAGIDPEAPAKPPKSLS